MASKINTTSHGYVRFKDRSGTVHYPGRIVINGTLAFDNTQPDLEWVYYGTSGSEDGTYDDGATTSSTCKSVSYLQGKLTDNRDPNNYSENYIMKVLSARTVSDPMFGDYEEDCTDRYFRAEAV